MRVHQARQNQSAFRAYHHGRRPNQFLCIACTSRKDDPPRTNGHRFHGPVERVLGVNRCVGHDGVGRRERRSPASLPGGLRGSSPGSLRRIRRNPQKRRTHQ